MTKKKLDLGFMYLGLQKGASTEKINVSDSTCDSLLVEDEQDESCDSPFWNNTQDEDENNCESRY